MQNLDIFSSYKIRSMVFTRYEVFEVAWFTKHWRDLNVNRDRTVAFTFRVEIHISLMSSGLSTICRFVQTIIDLLIILKWHWRTRSNWSCMKAGTSLLDGNFMTHSMAAIYINLLTYLSYFIHVAWLTFNQVEPQFFYHANIKHTRTLHYNHTFNHAITQPSVVSHLFPHVAHPTFTRWLLFGQICSFLPHIPLLTGQENAEVSLWNNKFLYSLFQHSKLQ